MAKLTITDAARMGFSSEAGFRAFNSQANRDRLVHDAALQTAPSTTVPIEYLIFLDPQVIEILTSPLRARELFGEQRYGDWTTPAAKFGAKEFTGSVQPYTDFGQSRTAGVNYAWMDRDNFLFQTVIEYGDLEQAVTSQARLNLAADKQTAAAWTIDRAANRFSIFGVAGKRIYGILNDPNLPASMTPTVVDTNKVKWTDKTTAQIYNDILAMFTQLQTQSASRIDERSALKLAVAPEVNALLAKATDFNVSVMDMLRKYFSRLEVVVLPELHDATAGNTAMLIATDFEDSVSNANILGFSEKFRAGRVVPDLSSFSQKIVAGTYGFILRQPFAIVTMKGM